MSPELLNRGMDMTKAASKRLRQQREAAPLPPPYSKDEIAEAIAADERVRNSYHSLSSHVRKHVGSTDHSLEPDEGTIIHDLWRRAKLRKRQLMAWAAFTKDLERTYGNSGPLCASYQQSVSKSAPGTPRTDTPDDEPISAHGLADVSLASWAIEHDTIQQKWLYLRREERGIMEQLIRDHIRVTRGVKIHRHDLAYMGNFLSGYNDNRQCIAAMVSRIQAVLSNLADLYMIKE